MKFKRMIVVTLLVIFSVVCFYSMNEKYDRLARYQYANDQNRNIIETHLSDDDINYIIQQKIKPEQFMDFILLDGFNIHNTLYYELCKNEKPTDLQYIVNFINKYRNQFNYNELENILNHYEYLMLEEFYNGAYTYVDDAVLIVNPKETEEIEEKETLYKYVPSDLINVNDSMFPSVITHEGTPIQIKSAIVQHYKELCEALKTVNHEAFGGLILTEGYVSYDQQIKKYNEALVKYGFEKVKSYEDYPGQSYRQLGNTISLTIAGKETAEDIKSSKELEWLRANAKTYGFSLVTQTIEGKEAVKIPITLRYDGVDTSVNDVMNK